MSKLKVLDLFSGIGGFSLGLERTGGFETKAFCEMKPHAQAVLAKNFPGVPCHSDVTTYPFTEGEADVITAGFPCQDISFAGIGAGLAGARSGLYREVVRAIRVVRPRYAVLENVAALLSRGLGTVLGDVAAVGYDAEWHCIPASAAGAPHRRDRVWIVANARGEQHEGYSAPLSGSIAAQLSDAVARNAGTPLGHGAEADAQRPHADGPGSHRAQEHLFGDAEFRHQQIGQPGSLGEEVADPDIERSKRRRVSTPTRRGSRADTQRSGAGEHRSPARQSGWWATEPGLGRVAHGVPNRVDRLEELGNAVVPQIPEIIGHAILESIRPTP